MVGVDSGKDVVVHNGCIVRLLVIRVQKRSGKVQMAEIPEALHNFEGWDVPEQTIKTGSFNKRMG